MKLQAIIAITVFTCLFAAQYTFGQHGSAIDSLVIIPSTPTVNNEVKLVCYATFPTGDCVLNNHSIDFQGNEITVMLNYLVGDYTAICHSVDTLTMGTLPADNYELTAYMTINLLEAIFDTDTVNFTVDNVLGINNTSFKNEFEIYPNPSSGEMTIIGTYETDLNYVEIYSIHGNKVFQQEVKKNRSINASHLTNGLYIVIMTDRKGHQYKKKIVKYTPF